MARRTGITAMQDVARRMCNLAVAFTPIIKKVFPDSVALHLAIETANTACAVLYEEIEKVREYGD